MILISEEFFNWLKMMKDPFSFIPRRDYYMNNGQNKNSWLFLILFSALLSTSRLVWQLWGLLFYLVKNQYILMHVSVANLVIYLQVWNRNMN